MVALFWQLEVSKTWLEGATIAGLRRKFGRWVVVSPGSPGSHLVHLVCGGHLDTWVTLFTWWVAGQVPQLP